MARPLSQSTLYKVLNLQAGEGKAVFLLVAYSLLMGAALGVFYTCTTSLFLTNFASSQLPLAFVVGGVIVYLLGQVVRVLRSRFSFTTINGYLVLFLLLSVGGLLLAGSVLHSKWPYFMLLLWQRVFVFVYGLTFWGTAGRLFNFGQAKRLFSFIGMGEVIASILSYLSVPVLLKFISIDKLLLLSLVFLGLCVLLLVYINGQFRAQLTGRAAVPVANEPVTTVVAIPITPTGKAYYSLLYLLALMPVFGLIYVDFMFSVLSKQIFPTKEILAGFLGFFFGICSIIELLIKLFLYRRLMNAYSIRFGIVVLPLALLVSYTLGAVYGTFYGVTSLFFAFVALSRFFMNPLRRAISEPAFQLLFQPIPSAERTLLLSRIEGGPKALGTLLPGLLLMGLYALGLSSMVVLSYTFIAVLVFWAISTFRIQDEYRAVLGEAIGRSTALFYQSGIRSKTPAPPAGPLVLVASNHSLEALGRLAGSAVASERRAAATALGQSGRFYAYQHLLALLADPDPAVCEAAIWAAGKLRKPELWPGLFEYLGTDCHRAAATQALLEVGEPVIPALTRLFKQTDLAEARQAEIVAVVRRIGGEAAKLFLRASINHPSQLVRDHVFRGLSSLHHRATVTERPYVLRQLDEQVGLLVWLAATQLDLGEYARQSPLMLALRRENQGIVPKVFSLLSVLYGNNQFDVICELINQKNAEIQSFLLELLSTILPAEVKNNILPLFADVPIGEKVRKSAINYPQQRLGVEERLHDFINKDYNKTTSGAKAVAIWELLTWHQSDPTAILVANAVLPDELLAETALYVLYCLNPTRFADLHTTLRAQPASLAHQLAERIAAGLPEESLLVQRLVVEYCGSADLADDEQFQARQELISQ